jgi:hypothetical protein
MVRPMPCPPKIANHREAAAPHFAFDRAANLEHTEAGARHHHSFGKGLLSTSDQAPIFFGNFADSNRLGGVGHESVFLNRDVELDQVAGLNCAVARNTVHGFIVQADAIHAWKFVDQLWCRLRAVFPHDVGADRIQFGGSDARTHCPLHGFEHSPDNHTRGTHGGKVFRTRDGHASSGKFLVASLAFVGQLGPNYGKRRLNRRERRGGEVLRAGNFQAEFFRQSFADFRGQAIVYAARSQLGGVDHRHGRRRGYRYSQPDQGGKRESHQRGDFQPEGVPGVEMEDHAKSHQEDCAGKRGQGDQGEINVAVQMLSGTAVGAAVKVLFVVFTHLGRKAGDVITPAGKNFSNNGINALAHKN